MCAIFGRIVFILPHALSLCVDSVHLVAVHTFPQPSISTGFTDGDIFDIMMSLSCILRQVSLSFLLLFILSITLSPFSFSLTLSRSCPRLNKRRILIDMREVKRNHSFLCSLFSAPLPGHPVLEALKNLSLLNRKQLMCVNCLTQPPLGFSVERKQCRSLLWFLFCWEVGRDGESQCDSLRGHPAKQEWVGIIQIHECCLS